MTYRPARLVSSGTTALAVSMVVPWALAAVIA
jgi:hypothetical protein